MGNKFQSVLQALWWICGIVSLSSHYHLKKKKKNLTIQAIVFIFCSFPLAMGTHFFSETQKLFSKATAEFCSMPESDSLVLSAAQKGGRDSFQYFICPNYLFLPIRVNETSGIVYHRLYIC